MSTSAPTVDQSQTGLDLSIKTENITYQVWVKLDEKSQVIEDKTTYRAVSSDEKKEESVTANLIKEGYQLAKTQTVKAYKAGSMEGFLEIIGDPDEALNVANRGLAAKFNQKIKEYLTDFDSSSQSFVNPQTDEVFDSRELLQDPTQRRSLSQNDKIIRDLRKSGLSDTQIAAMIAALQSSGAAQ